MNDTPSHPDLPDTNDAGETVGMNDDMTFEESLAIDMPTESGDHCKLTNQPQTEPQDNSTQPAWVGKRMGRFKLLRLIGEGTMGRVIQALDMNLDRIVALKILRKQIEGAEQSTLVKQFFREAKAAAKLEHPNVVNVYEISEHDGWWYIVMEMVEGDTLKNVVKAAGPLPPYRACPIIADAASALATAHAMGIIHRDIKPSNLLINRMGRCKLVDFGLVRLNDPNDPFDFTKKSVGTPMFMAPEVIRNTKQGAPVDIYALGGCLYFALTGNPPYRGKKISDIARQHLESPPPDVQQVIPDCSSLLAQIIQRAMAKDPAQRPSPDELAASLRAEAIDTRPDDSGTWASSSSGFYANFNPVGRGHVRHKKRIAWGWIKKNSVRIFGGLVIVGILATIISLALSNGSATTDSQGKVMSLDDRFPQARSSYGVRPAGLTPKSTSSHKPAPPFSWVGKIDPANFKYVASRSGNLAYPVDAPEAALIRADLFVGYPSAIDARADGKAIVE